MKPYEREGQPFGVLSLSYHVCKACRIVDQDENRTTIGYSCPNCLAIGQIGNQYFPISVWSLMNLMQEYFHSNAVAINANRIDPKPENIHRLAVAIFFSTLVEVLMENLLKEFMAKLKLPGKIMNRLFEDSLYFSQRSKKLFPSLSGVKWKDAINAISSPSYDYNELMGFCQSVSKERNRFLHEGNQWAISIETPEKCMERIHELLEMFVKLHNTYVAKVGEHQRDISSL